MERDTLTERARELEAVGRDDEARALYLEALQRSPERFEALFGLGALCARTGFTSAARTLLERALQHAPRDLRANIALGHALHDMGEWEAARRRYALAVELAPDNFEAHEGLSQVFMRLGNEPQAAVHRDLAFKDRALTKSPFRGSTPPVNLLLLFSSAGGNTPILPYIDDRIYAVYKIIPEYYQRTIPLPPHDLVFNAISDADRCKAALEAATLLLQATRSKVLNGPGAVLATTRAENSQRMAGLPGVLAPKTMLQSRSFFESRDVGAKLRERGFTFPLLLRSPGFHTGQHFAMVESTGALAESARALPGEELMALEYLDARGSDGKFRKYRVMIIDGALYPLHLAVSDHWKVHYFSSAMAESSEYRDEERAFLADMAAALGPGPIASLQEIGRVLALDYAGIDFGRGANGEVLFFEGNATMIVPRPDPDERFAYRRAPIERIQEAIRRMLKA